MARPRFSILNLVLLMTVIGMGVQIWRLNAESAILRAEAVRYRQQLGHLSIPQSESDKIHAIRVESEEDHEWRYRIYLPEGHKYRLFTRVGVLPGRTGELVHDPEKYYAAISRHSSGTSTTWEPGEYVLVFRVRPFEVDDDERTHWSFESRRIGEGSYGMFKTTVPWMDDTRAWSSSSSMVSQKQKSFEIDKPLPLLTVRRNTVTETPGGFSAQSPPIIEDADGFALWISAF